MVIREDFNLTEEEIKELADIGAFMRYEGQEYTINLDDISISSRDKESMTILAKLNNRALPTSFNLKEVSEHNINLVERCTYSTVSYSLEVIMPAPDAMDYEDGEDMTDEDYMDQVRDCARCYTELMGCEEGQLKWTYNETHYDGPTINFNLN